ncbi:MFS transporter [bacterium]|nr:MFS transporter [bacterium]
MDAGERLREKSLVYSLRDGMAWSVMVGCGENYIGAYALFLGASTLQMGILSSLPPFLGALSQTVSAWLTDLIRFRRKIILPAAVFQGTLWLPLFFLPGLFGDQSVPVFIGLAALLAAAGHFISPPWNSLMGDVVHPDRRGIYFARRNRACHVVTVIAVALGGTILHVFKTEFPDQQAYGFLAIFAIASAARFVSAGYLSLQYEPPYHPAPKELQFGYLAFLRSMRRSNFARFAAVIALMNFSIHVSAPFFIVYILRDLHFSYLQFTAVTSLMVLSQILTLAFWGRTTDRFGNKWALVVSGVVISVAPFFLTVSAAFPYIAAFAFFVGAAGAGYNLATANYVFDAVSPPQRARCVAYFSVTNSAGFLLGGLLGGWLGDRLPAALDLGLTRFHFSSPLLTLFCVSGCLRLAALLLFRPAFRELRSVERAPDAGCLFRIAFFRTTIDARFEPLAPPRLEKGANEEEDGRT